MLVYPYKTQEGRYSVLEALDLENAEDHLLSVYGPGILFCEVEMDYVDFQKTFCDQDEGRRAFEKYFDKSTGFAT